MSAARKTFVGRPDIFHFHDIRLYLAKYFEFLRAEDPQFSLRRFSKSVSLSPGQLPLIMAGRITLTENVLNKIIPQLHLPQNEVIFLHWMRTLSESHSQAEKVRAFNNIRRHGRFSESQKNELDAYKYLTKWFYPAVRELASWPNFELDAKWIRAQLDGKISLAEANEAIVFLISKGFWVQGAEGKVQFAEPNLRCTGGIFRLAASEYHCQSLDLAKASIFDSPRDERELNAMILSIDRDDMPQLKSIFEETLQKIKVLSDSKKPRNLMMQINLLAFPLAKNAQIKKPQPE